MARIPLRNRERDMTLTQLSFLKRWHVEHRADHPVEYHVWDMMLTAWVMGWVALPAALILWVPQAVVACLVFFAAPTLYVRLRERLHRQGRVRCDWLDALASTRRPHKALWH